MPGLLDELAPLTVGSERFALALADPSTPARAFNAFDVSVDYALCEPEGIVLPLELIVTSPSRARRSFYTRVVPQTLTILPDEGGRWLVMLREVAHNRWWGRLAVDVAGERINR